MILAANKGIGHECLKILLQEKQDVIRVVTDQININLNGDLNQHQKRIEINESMYARLYIL